MLTACTVLSGAAHLTVRALQAATALSEPGCAVLGWGVLAFAGVPGSWLPPCLITATPLPNHFLGSMPTISLAAWTQEG